MRCSLVPLRAKDSLSNRGLQNSAVALVELFERSGLKWASNDTKMSVANVRLHLRVLRRLSLAVLDQANPSYEHSALFYFDKNEEFFGRKVHKACCRNRSSISMPFKALCLT